MLIISAYRCNEKTVYACFSFCRLTKYLVPAQTAAAGTKRFNRGTDRARAITAPMQKLERKEPLRSCCISLKLIL
jgi:hypothetical protein